MITQRIVFTQPSGGVGVIVPCDCGLPVAEIARKDVPAGVEFWIINDTDLPPRDYRDAWELDPVALGPAHGIGIGADAWFAEQNALKLQAALTAPTL